MKKIETLKKEEAQLKQNWYTEVAQPTPVENPISDKLELCIDRINTIHGRVDDIREKVSGEGQSEQAATTPNSIDGMTDTLLSMIINLHEKIDIINEKL